MRRVANTCTTGFSFVPCIRRQRNSWGNVVQNRMVFWFVKQSILQVQAVEISRGIAVSEVVGVDFSVKMSKRFV